MPTVKNHIIREEYDGKTCLVHARMCPVGCEKYGSDNAVFLSVIE